MGVVVYYTSVSIVCFLLPLLISYLALSRGRSCRLSVEVRMVRFRIFAYLLFTCALFFIYITVEGNVFFRRIGHKGLAANSLNMPIFWLAFSRLFSETSIFITMVIHVVLLHSGRRHSKITRFCILGYFLTVLTFILINSRMHALVLLLSHFCISAMHGDKKKVYRAVPKLTALAFAAIVVVLVSRATLAEGQASASSLLSIVNSGASTTERLNGSDILVDLHEDIAQKGLMHGAAWKNSIMVYYYMIFDTAKYFWLKDNMRTTPKVTIYEHYRGEHIIDRPSSIIADVYVNFGALGLILSGVIVGALLSYVRFGLNNTTSTFTFLSSLYLIPLLFQFEKEFISLIIMLLKYSITLFLLYKLKLFSVNRLK